MDDGTAIIPKKKCYCKNHRGPHWVYLDQKSRLENMSLPGLQNAYAELDRMKKLEREMNKYGVLHIFGAEETLTNF